MKQLPAVFKACSTVFGVLPGIGVLAARLGTPPGKGTTFGAVLLTVGPLALLMLWLYQKTIQRWTRRRVVRACLILASASLIAMALYFWCYSKVVVRFGDDDLVLPLWPRSDLAFMLAKAGNAIEASYMYGVSAVKDAIEEQPAIAQAGTLMIMLVLYETVFLALTLAFGIAGFKIGPVAPVDEGAGSET